MTSNTQRIIDQHCLCLWDPAGRKHNDLASRSRRLPARDPRPRRPKASRLHQRVPPLLDVRRSRQDPQDPRHPRQQHGLRHPNPTRQALSRGKETRVGEVVSPQVHGKIRRRPAGNGSYEPPVTCFPTIGCVTSSRRTDGSESDFPERRPPRQSLHKALLSKDLQHAQFMDGKTGLRKEF